MRKAIPLWLGISVWKHTLFARKALLGTTSQDNSGMRLGACPCPEHQRDAAPLSLKGRSEVDGKLAVGTDTLPVLQ